MSFLNTTHKTCILTPVPNNIPLSSVLALLHNHEKMITMNPLVTAHTLLVNSDTSLTSSTSHDFFKSEIADLQPTESLPCEIWEITDDMSSDKEAGGGSWRGGWASRFVPDKITYLSSLQDREDGLVSVTHAPMGVHSVTTWKVRKEGEGLVLEESGEVRASRFLMGFIKTTLQSSHEKLVKDFMGVLGSQVESEAGKRGEEKVGGDQMSGVEVRKENVKLQNGLGEELK